jgi:hypothetical protein
MAFPAIADSVATIGDVAVLDPTIDLPASSAGNLLIVFFSAPATHGSPTVPTGWTYIVSANKPAGDTRSGDRDQIMYRVCDGSEGTTLVVDTSATAVKFSALALLITGHDSATPPVISAVAVGTSNGPNSPSLTPAGGAKDFLWIEWADQEGESASLWTVGGSLTTDASLRSDTGTAGSTASNSVQQAAWQQFNAATFDPAGFTSDISEDWVAYTIAVYPAAGGTLFTQNLAGGMTPAGALKREPRKVFVAGFTPAGALSKRFITTKAGVIVPAGALIKQDQKRLTGGVTPTGAVVNSRLALKSLAGAITPTGALIRRPGKALSGAISSNGAITKRINIVRAGAITPTGAVLKQVQKRFTGALTPAGAVALLAVKTRSFAGSITPTGSLLKLVAKTFTGTLASAGSLSKQIIRRFTGSITSSGVVSLLAVKTKQLAGTLTPTGTLLKRVSRTLTAALVPAGNLTRQPQKRVTGALTGSGTVANVKTQPSISIAGTLTLSGTLLKRLNRTLTGAIPSAGSLRRLVAKGLSGALSLAGSIANVIIPKGLGSIERLIELRNLLFAADPTIQRLDLSGEKPFTFAADTLYVWEDDLRNFPVANDRATFAYMAVVGMPDRGEQAKQIGDPIVSESLDDRAALLVNALRSNQQGDEWDYITAWVDTKYLTTYGVRGFAVRITGYKLG